jgi:L-asparaginase
MKSPVLVIHGGAGSRSLSPERRRLILKSLEGVLTSVYGKLKSGGCALEAVTLAVRALEDDPLYNAGKGSKIQSDGRIRMSAALMDGNRRRFAGCVNVERVKNPIRLARVLMRQQDRVLNGTGAARFARALKLPFASPFTAEARHHFAQAKRGKTGTVGAVALDREGRLAAATSTGGKGMEYPGRVSDTPTVAGNFANSMCAVSATGIGEEIVEFAAAATVCAYVEAGMTVDRAVSVLLARARGRQFGLIALDRKGQYKTSTNTPLLIWGAADKKGHHFTSGADR